MAASYYRDHPYNNPQRNDRHSGGHRPPPPRTEDSSDSYVEEIDREFPPGAGYRQPWSPDPRVHAPDGGRGDRRTHSAGGRRGAADDYYSHHDSYRPSRRHRPRHRSRSRSSSASRSPTPRPKARRQKSLSEQALEALGLGGVAGALGGKHSAKHHRNHSYDDYDRRRGRDDRDYGRGRRHRRNSSPSVSPSGRGSRSNHSKQMRDIVGAALAAGAAEAFHARKEPGGWTGEKGRRIITAAITAGGADKMLERGGSNKHSKRHMLESTIAGLATNHLLNGPRSKSRSRRGRRARSEHRGGPKDLASAGILAAAGKKAYDHYRSKSRGRPEHSGYSSDESSRSRPRNSKKRSKSVTDYVNKGLAALGLDESRRRSPSPSDSDGYSDRHHRPRRYREVGRTHPSSGSGYRCSSSQPPGHNQEPDENCSHSDSDLGISSDEERTRRKMLNKEVLTAGLATIATIHAGHGIYQSAQKRKERIRKLREGEIGPEEARRERMMGNLKDAASVSLAALGIKGTVDEWKETAKHHSEYRSFNQQCRQRAKKRQRARSLSLGGR